MKENFFISLCVLSLLFAVGVVFSKNAIYSAFNLVLCFFSLAFVYVCWHAPFIAMIQVLVYTGAIVVLFVFVVMLLDLVKDQSTSSGVNFIQIFLSGALASLFSVQLYKLLARSNVVFLEVPTKTFSLKQVAKLLFVDYLWPFEVLSAFLLAIIVAAYILTRPQHDYKVEEL